MDFQGLQTLFLEMLFKLMSLGHVPFVGTGGDEVGTIGPSFKAQDRGSRLPGSGVPRCPCPREESLNSGRHAKLPLDQIPVPL